MASLRISPPSPGGIVSFIDRTNKSHQKSHLTPSLHLTNSPTNQLKVSASVALPSPPILSSCPFSTRNRNQESALFSVNIDAWMRDSVVDIVKNLKKAPLLVSVGSDIDGQGILTSNFNTEKAIEENWPVLKDEWERGVTKSPDGIIYVEEIVGEDYEGIVEEEQKEEEGVTRAWGILAQVKGVRVGPACYLLKTCRVEGGLGMGLFCTHYCLVRVKSFKKSALEQLKDCWLLN